MIPARLLWPLAALLGVAPAFAALAPAPPPPARGTAPTAETEKLFEEKVRPLLFEKCFSCHGDTKQFGDLRLDSRAALLKGGTTGPAVVPGDPEKSLLIQAVHQSGALKMPPAGKLTPAQVADLERWVRLGAYWPEPRGGKPKAAEAPHWAFLPVRPQRPPAVKDSAWARNPIDAFLRARLEAAGLPPAAPADRRTLIRRVTFDLIGLPPTPAEVQAFVSDRSPDAFEKVVDRLLASPHFGERWGRHWLDLVRYCDSFDARLLGENNGGNVMDVRDAWRYRDWVVSALNRDLPYDRFLTHQVAGDLLTARGEAGVDGIIATGMLAIGNWGGGDADKEKLLTDIADDQLDVVSRTFMGVTLSCARCHDHKFDPFTTQDYYALAGIFFSTHILENVGPKTNGPPMLRIPLLTPAEKQARERYAARAAELEGELKRETEAAYTAHAQKMLPETARYLTAAWEATRGGGTAGLERLAAERGLQPAALSRWIDYLGLSDYPLMTVPVSAHLGVEQIFAWKGAADTPSLTVNATDREQTLFTFKLPPRSVSVHPGPSNGVAVNWTSPLSGEVEVTLAAADADPVSGDGVAWALDHRGTGGVRELAAGNLPNGGAGGTASPVTVRVARGETLQLLILPKNGHGWDTTTVRFTLREKDGARAWDLAEDVIPDPLLGGRGNPRPDRYGNAGVWSFRDMADRSRGGGIRSDDPALAAWSEALRTAPAGDAARPRIEAAAAAFARSFQLVDARSPFWPAAGGESALEAPARERLARLRAALEEHRRQAPPPVQYANGAQEGGVPGSPHAGVHDVPVHIRGSYSRLGEVVPRRFPVVLAGEQQPPLREGSGRLELARWLASPENPLTARVMVNRVWQHLFGEGLVRTPSNFGKLGEPPTHPELLDYLASVFTSPASGDTSVAGAGTERRSDGETERVRTAALRGPAVASGSKGSKFIPHPSSFIPQEGLGWSVKRLIRLMVLSSAYQQSSAGDPRTEARDPDNRLFGRQNRRRLEAELLRDSLLAVTGTLDRRQEGPATRDFNDPRRTLYQMTVRSDRSGYGPLFDVADPTAHVDRRTVSTVAPQALFMLNHPFVLARAKTLAERVRREAPESLSRIRLAYLLLYGRPPRSAELALGQQFLREAEAAGQGERAWEEYALVLLCANEFTYVD
ncbi:MAG: PSD1 and planctomycete cytochrome C domain-containing protein [Armatimonadota bacterium]